MSAFAPLLALLIGCAGPSLERWGPTPSGAPVSLGDADADGWPLGLDCDDQDARVHPGADELCDAGVDNDCEPDTQEMYGLWALNGLPDGGTAVVCAASLRGNVSLEDRRLTVRGSGEDILEQEDGARPLFEVSGGELELVGVRVVGAGEPFGVRPLVARAGAIRLVDASVAWVGDVGVGLLLAEAGAEVSSERTTWEGASIRTDVAGGAITSTDSALSVVDSAFDGFAVLGAGGVIHAERSTLSVTGAAFRANDAEGAGGAIYALDSVVQLSGSSFSANAGATGGAVHAVSCDLLALDTTFESNVADDDGGALWLGGTPTTFGGVDFLANTAAGDGGAIHAQASELDGDLVTFTANRSLGDAPGGGGALHLLSAADTTARGWVFDDNRALGRGGAVYVQGAAFAGDLATVVLGNTASFGGGVALGQDGASFVGGAIRDNDASYGGGVYGSALDGAVAVEAAVTGNVARLVGGGIFVDLGAVEVQGAVADNVAEGAGGGVWLSPGTTVSGGVAWGADDAANVPEDVASLLFAQDYAADSDVDCTDQGCATP